MGAAQLGDSGSGSLHEVTVKMSPGLLSCEGLTRAGRSRLRHVTHMVVG